MSASRINNSGQVVVYANGQKSLWEDGIITPFAHPSYVSSSGPEDINNIGQVIGTANGTTVIWEDGDLTPLGSWGPKAINDSGQAIGYVEVPAHISDNGTYHR